MPRRRPSSLEWLIVHEATACVSRIRDDDRPDLPARRLLITVSNRECQRFVAHVLNAKPTRRYYPCAT